MIRLWDTFKRDDWNGERRFMDEKNDDVNTKQEPEQLEETIKKLKARIAVLETELAKAIVILGEYRSRPLGPVNRQ